MNLRQPVFGLLLTGVLFERAYMEPKTEFSPIDFTIDPADIAGSFTRIADELMNRRKLRVGPEQYRLAEIEFYYRSEAHPDEYIHAHELQLEKGRWYFHGSGLDITFGDGHSYGGILIRAVHKISDRTYVYGPLRCITEFFGNLPSVYESECVIGLVEAAPGEFVAERPVAAPRVGLNPAKDKGHYGAFYRYLIMPRRMHAEKYRIAEAMRQQGGYSEEEIKLVCG